MASKQMAVKPTTKSQAVEIAQDQLQKRGFNGFSFQDVADSLGIKKASLHYYFGSKEELGLALIMEYQTAFAGWTEKVAALPVKQKLDKFLHIFSSMTKDEFKICPMGVLCSDLNTLPVKMKNKLREFHDEQRKWLTRTLQQGIHDGVIKKSIDADCIADTLLSTIQGSLQLAQIGRAHV